VQTENGKTMPIDAQPSTDGRFRKERVEHDAQGREVKIVHFVRDDELNDNRSRRLYASHFQTCPNAAQHRKT
jgi:hypothetical protein